MNTNEQINLIATSLPYAGFGGIVIYALGSIGRAFKALKPRIKGEFTVKIG